jgi:hypothetical protein
MDNFVTQRECEERRKEIEQKGEVRYSEFIQTKVDISAMRSDIRQLSVMIKWFMGLISSFIVGTGVWLITR